MRARTIAGDHASKAQNDLKKMLEGRNGRVTRAERLRDSVIRVLVNTAIFTRVTAGEKILSRGSTRLTRKRRGIGPRQEVLFYFVMIPHKINTVQNGVVKEITVESAEFTGHRAGRLPEFIYNAEWDSAADPVNLERAGDVFALKNGLIATWDLRFLSSIIRRILRTLCEAVTKVHRTEAAPEGTDELATGMITPILNNAANIPLADAPTEDMGEEPTVETPRGLLARAWEAVTGSLTGK